MLKKSLLLLACSSALFACGGGSSGGGGGTPEADLVITEENATEVAAQAADVALEAVGEPDGFDFISGGGAFKSQTQKTLNAVKEHYKISRNEGIVLDNQTFDCDVSGTVTYDFEDFSDGFNSGDQISVTYDNCVQSAEESIDGRTSFRITGTTGDIESGDYSLSYTFSFDNLVETYEGVTSTIDGNFVISITAQDGVISFTTRIDSLSGSDDDDTYEIHDYEVSSTYNDLTGDYETSVEGTFTADELGGTVVIRTIDAMSGNIENEYPTSGILEIVGANGTSILMTVEVGGVQLDIDTDGDGETDITRDVTWQELEEAVEEELDL